MYGVRVSKYVDRVETKGKKENLVYRRFRLRVIKLP